MDNAYILLLIIKKRINIGNFINWYNNCVLDESLPLPSYKKYVDDFNYWLKLVERHEYLLDDYDLGDVLLTEFEFSYFTSYLRLLGELS